MYFISLNSFSEYLLLLIGKKHSHISFGVLGYKHQNNSILRKKSFICWSTHANNGELMERPGRYTGIRQGWKYKNQKGQKPSFINDSL